MTDESNALKKNGFFTKLQVFFKEIAGEFKRVVWPDRKQLINNTVMVLLVCLVIGALIWVLDGGFSIVRTWLYGVKA